MLDWIAKTVAFVVVAAEGVPVDVASMEAIQSVHGSGTGTGVVGSLALTIEGTADAVVIKYGTNL